MQKGQALLLVVVSMSAIVTVVLSVVARSVTDIKTVSREEEALRAFSAAEAGIEQALVTQGSGGGTTTLNDSGDLSSASFTASVSNFGEASTSFVYPRDLVSGESATLWFVSHDTTGALSCSGSLACFRAQNVTSDRIRVCWGSSGNSPIPALEFSLYFDPNANGSYSDLSVSHVAYDPDRSASRGGSNGLLAPDSGSCTIGTQTFPYQKTIDLSADLLVPQASFLARNGLLFARARTLYNTSQAIPVAIDVSSSGGVLPGQGRSVQSTGSSGEAVRKVEVFTLYPDFPEIFDGSVFSGGDLIK